MTPSQKNRLYLVLAILVGAAATTALTVTAFRQNMLFFLTPSQIVAGGDLAGGREFRLGGLVGEVSRTEGKLEIRFEVTDTAETVIVSYSGVLPDLFREGQGVVVRGRWDNGVFVAAEVLAKHDENYVPPELSDSLEQVGIRLP